jgi:AbrB family transcriptional regulator, transcriptional pleiotropic regulator of transition state genes
VSSGVSRKVDQLGRVVLPAELRKQLEIRVGDLIEISVDDERIVLQKVAQRCVFCGATAPARELRDFEEKLVCEPCVEKLTASGA